MPHRNAQQIRDNRFTRSSPSFHRASLALPTRQRWARVSRPRPRRDPRSARLGRSLALPTRQRWARVSRLLLSTSRLLVTTAANVSWDRDTWLFFAGWGPLPIGSAWDATWLVFAM